MLSIVTPLVRSLVVCWFVVGMIGSSSAQQASPSNPANPGNTSGIQSVNINDVKPDASTLPGYGLQNNAQRNAVQPGNNAPIWREVNSGQAGYSSLPNPEAGVLIQRSGEWWREMRNGRILVYGAWLLLAMASVIALFYWRRGAITLDEPQSGRLIQRFTSFERSMHWTMAVSFVILAISGLIMMFGKYLLLPIVGGTLFGGLTYLLKNLHNFIGPIFAISLLVTLVVWMRDNLPAKGDLQWLLKAGGLFSKGSHVASNRFNAGEKLWFWLGVFALGLVVAASGFFLDKIVPGMTYSRGNMQLAHIIHAVATLLMMTIAMGHIYIGTIGTEGAMDGMRTGYVDEVWAKQHHETWYNDIKAGRIAAHRGTVQELLENNTVLGTNKVA